MTTSDPIRLATRGSALATYQANRVRAALEDHRHDVELVEVSTRGDELREELIHDLGKKGAFVHSVDQTVIDGEADAAVHSLKDVPTEDHAAVEVAAVPDRAPAGDVLVTPDGAGIDDLPSGGTVGTASLRRGAQLQARRPDLTVEPLRGNVDTRIEKVLAPSLQREHQTRLDDDDADAAAWFEDRTELERRALGREIDTEYDAIVIARAGLERLDLPGDVPATPLPIPEFVPAPAQGALAVTANDEAVVTAIRRALDHPPTRVAVTTERTVLATLGGGCVAPIGVHATIKGPVVLVRAQILSLDGDQVIADTRELPVEDHVDAARSFASDLADRGAADLVDAAREVTAE
ncbi:MAG: hydroxymethylbilane synthase [Halobacteriaceae archaeon]